MRFFPHVLIIPPLINGLSVKELTDSLIPSDLTFPNVSAPAASPAAEEKQPHWSGSRSNECRGIEKFPMYVINMDRKPIRLGYMESVFSSNNITRVIGVLGLDGRTLRDRLELPPPNLCIENNHLGGGGSGSSGDHSESGGDHLRGGGDHLGSGGDHHLLSSTDTLPLPDDLGYGGAENICEYLLIKEPAKYSLRWFGALPGELGCTISHLDAMKQAWLRKHPVTLIAEDDLGDALCRLWPADLTEVVKYADQNYPDWFSIRLQFSAGASEWDWLEQKWWYKVYSDKSRKPSRKDLLNTWGNWTAEMGIPLVQPYKAGVGAGATLWSRRGLEWMLRQHMATEPPILTTTPPPQPLTTSGSGIDVEDGSGDGETTPSTVTTTTTTPNTTTTTTLITTTTTTLQMTSEKSTESAGGETSSVTGISNDVSSEGQEDPTLTPEERELKRSLSPEWIPQRWKCTPGYKCITDLMFFREGGNHTLLATPVLLSTRLAEEGSPIRSITGKSTDDTSHHLRHLQSTLSATRWLFSIQEGFRWAARGHMPQSSLFPLRVVTVER